MSGTSYRDIPVGTSLDIHEEYHPSSFDELELYPGDTVVIEALDSDDISRIPDGFLKGVNRHLGPSNGKSGYFPAYLVQLPPGYEIPEQLQRMHSKSASSVGSIAPTNGMIVGNAESQVSIFSAIEGGGSEHQFSDSGPHASGSDDPDSAYIQDLENRVQIGSRVGVRFEYHATKEDELELKLSDVIVVTHFPSGGWWRGAKLSDSGLGKTGWFPCNFVRLLPDEDSMKSKSGSYKRASSANSGMAASKDEPEKSKSRFWQRKLSKADTGKPGSPGQSDAKLENGSQDFGSESLSVVNDHQSGGKPARMPSIAGPASASTSMISSMTRKMSLKQLPAFSSPDLTAENGLNVEEIILNSETPTKPPKKSWKDSVPQEVLDKLTPADVKKQQVLWELYVTEVAYVKDLKMTIDLFMRPIVKEKLLSPKITETVFSNLESIFATNYHFYKSLQQLYAESPMLEYFGSCFVEACENFFVYSAYCGNHAKAVQKVKDLQQNNKAFRNFLTDTYRDPATRHLDLASYLIKPVQRICKYPLLLMEILKCTDPNHPDRGNIEVALAKVQNVLMVVNDGVDGNQKMFDLQNSFTEKVAIFAPTRYFVREDQVSILTAPPDSRTKPRTLYLFNDMLILAKKDWREKNHIIENTPLARVNLVEMPDPSKFMFELQVTQSNGSDSVRYLIIMSSKEQKDGWIQSFKPLIATCDRNGLSNSFRRSLSTSVSQDRSAPTIVETKSSEVPSDRRRSTKESLLQSAITTSQHSLKPTPPPVKTNSSQYDLTRSNSIASKRSRSNLAAAESPARQRSLSLNENAKEHMKIAMELFKDAPVVITRAQSQIDIADSHAPSVAGSQQSIHESQSSVVEHNVADFDPYSGESRRSSIAFSDVASVISRTHSDNGDGFEASGDAKVLQDMRQELDDLRMDILKKVHTIDEKDDEIYALREQVKKTAQTNATGLEIETLKKTNDQLRKDLTQLKEELNQSNLEKIEGRKEIERLNAQLKTGLGREQALTQKVEAMQVKNRKDLQEFQDAARMLNDVTEENGALKEANEKLSQENAVLMTKNAAITRALSINARESRQTLHEAIPTPLFGTSAKSDAPLAASHEYQIPTAVLMKKIEDLEKENARLRSDPPTAIQNDLRKDSLSVEVSRLSGKVMNLSQDLLNERASLQELRLSAMHLPEDKMRESGIDNDKTDAETQTNLAGIGHNMSMQTVNNVRDVAVQLDDDLLRNHAVVKDSIDQHAELYRDLEQKYEQLRVKHEKERDITKKLRADYETITGEIENLQMSQGAESEIMKRKLDADVVEIKKLKSSMRELTNEIDARDEKIKQCEDELTELKSEQSQNGGKLSELKSLQKTQNAQMEKLKERESALISKNESLMEKERSLQSRLAELEDLSRNLRQAKDSAEKAAQHSEIEVAKSAALLKESQAENSEMKASIRDNSRIEMENQQRHLKEIREVRDKIASVESELSSQHRKFDQLLLDNEMKAKTISSLKSEISQLEKELKDLEKTYADVCNERSQILLKAASSDKQEAGSLQSELRTLTEKNFTLDRESKDAKRSFAKYKHSSDSTIARLQEQIVKLSSQQELSEKELLRLQAFELNLQAAKDELQAFRVREESTTRDLKAAKSALAAAEKQIKTMEEDAKSSKKKLVLINRKMLESRSEVTSEKEKSSQASLQISDLLSNSEGLKVEVAVLKSENAQLLKLKEKLATVTESNGQETLRLKNMIMKLESELEDAKISQKSFETSKVDAEKLDLLLRAIDRILPQAMRGGEINDAAIIEKVASLVDGYSKAQIYERKIVEIHSENQRKDAELAEILKTGEHLRKELSKAQKQFATDLENFNEESQARISKLMQEKRNLQMELDDSRINADTDQMPANQGLVVSQLKNLNDHIKRLQEELLEERTYKQSLEHDMKQLSHERNEALRQVSNRAIFVPARDFTESQEYGNKLFQEVNNLKQEVHKKLGQITDFENAITDLKGVIKRNSQIITEKEAETSKLSHCIDDYKRHLFKMEEMYGETISNREKDIKVLKSELEDMSRYQQRKRQHRRSSTLPPVGL
eukprot:Partr_v1_DN28968_c1_g1_i1_m26215 putative RhoGEF